MGTLASGKRDLDEVMMNSKNHQRIIHSFGRLISGSRPGGAVLCLILLTDRRDHFIRNLHVEGRNI